MDLVEPALSPMSAPASAALASIFRARDLLACGVRLGVICLVRAMPGCPAIAPGGRGSTGSWCCFLPGRRDGFGWSACREGLQAGDRGFDVGGSSRSASWPRFGADTCCLLV